jgi:hypothetical protein
MISLKLVGQVLNAIDELPLGKPPLIASGYPREIGMDKQRAAPSGSDTYEITLGRFLR